MITQGATRSAPFTLDLILVRQGLTVLRLPLLEAHDIFATVRIDAPQPLGVELETSPPTTRRSTTLLSELTQDSVTGLLEPNKKVWQCPFYMLGAVNTKPVA